MLWQQKTCCEKKHTNATASKNKAQPQETKPWPQQTKPQPLYTKLWGHESTINKAAVMRPQKMKL